MRLLRNIERKNAGDTGMTMRWRWILGLLAMTLVAQAAVCNELDQLVGALGGTDDAARVTARQLLPRHGARAVEKLLPLLEHADPAVHRAAYNVIEDIANMAGAPGCFGPRLEVTASLLKLVAPDRPADLKRKGLRLLPVIMPAGVDVAPIAALLQDPELREDARAALQHLGTPEASAALLAALPAVDPAFALALLDAVASIEDPASIAPIETVAATHDDAAVRAAALRALAHTGDPRLAGLFRDVRARATEETRADAETALMRLAESMARRGGNWDLAIGLYRELAANAEHDMARAAAVAGLGRFGDDTAVADIAQAAQNAAPAVEDAAVAAFEALRGRAAVNRIAERYPELPADLRHRLIPVFGRRGDAPLLALVAQEAGGPDAAMRLTALRALSQSAALDALPLLVEAARTGSEEERRLAMEGATRVAGSVGVTGDTAAAGKAFLSLYDLAEDDALRAAALEGIARYPVAEAYDTVMAALEHDALEGAARAALPGLFGPLAATGADDKALRVFDTVMAANPTPAAMVGMVSRLQGIQTGLDTTRLLGVINTWRLVGPFDWKSDADWDTAFVGEPDVALDAVYRVGDQELRWKPVTTADPLGLVDLTGNVAQRDRCFAYAYTEIEADEGGPAQLRIGSDDGNRVWLNGAVVWDNPVDRGAEPDQDIVDCRLETGVNRILVKISQGAGGWNFQLRITRPDGSAFPFRLRAE